MKLATAGKLRGGRYGETITHSEAASENTEEISDRLRDRRV